jgi:superfamily II DNA or RNA helicase
MKLTKAQKYGADVEHRRRLVPIVGCWVKDVSNGNTGTVIKVDTANGAPSVRVKWRNPGSDSWAPPSRLCAAFQIGMEVQEIPYARTRGTLGEGHVIENRRIGGRDQVLVEYPSTGQKIWVPYENLRAIRGVRMRFATGNVEAPPGAERFRLKSLAYALNSWNQNTGSLSRLDIDPLPHQIHLVHHILASGNLNWMVADDVGLGKTIEVGMLLAALQARGQFRRILLVTPAGLVHQWQEELFHKFGMPDFQIYGSDFNVRKPHHWKLYDKVIASIDKLKSEAHLEKLMMAEHWDMVVFDEAHRLSRRQWGSKLESTERFKLAAALRKKTDAMLLLSATPHQGMHDKFQALLELLRPELQDDIRMLDMHPEILSDMVIRNHKADVTDAAGEFIFKPKVTRAIEVPVGEQEKAFDRQLQAYLRKGYAASKRRGRKGIPIGFVMTVYRKLAASSIAAIHRAIDRRIERLEGERAAMSTSDVDDERFAGENEELHLEGSDRDEFFKGEISLLRDLKEKAKDVMSNDRKCNAFVDNIITPILEDSPEQRVLVFTEYRATQDFLTKVLCEKFGQHDVAQINGSMTFEERENAISRFEDKSRFLISTEAGGEGLNLHRRCHIMVNYDLPWNPMRLVQRIGRIYRYGQTENVVIFNLYAPQTLDAHVMNLMYTRIGQVVHDMAPVGVEFRSGLEDEILGEIAEMMDVQDILEEASSAGIDRTQERIDDALKRAREAVEKQRDLFEFVSSFNPEETKSQFAIQSEHVQAFVLGMFDQLKIEILDTLHKGQTLEIRLTEAVQEKLGFSRSRFKVTFDRRRAASRSDLEMMDFESPLFLHLIKQAQSYSFGGNCAAVSQLAGKAVLTAKLRWQNDQGFRMREEFSSLTIDSEGAVSLNSREFSDWLRSGAAEDAETTYTSDSKTIMETVERAIDSRLALGSNRSLHPENRQLLSAAWLREK